jgi:hypothetical protein
LGNFFCHFKVVIKTKDLNIKYALIIVMVVKKSLIAGTILAGLLNLANATDLKLYDTYLAKTYIPPDSLVYPSEVVEKIRGPPGTKMHLELTNGTKSAVYDRVFDENGYIRINDILNPDSTGIQSTFIPTNEMMEVFNNNVVFSTGINSKLTPEIKKIGVYDVKGALVSELKFNNHGSFVHAHWDGNGASEGTYFMNVETKKGNFAKKFNYNKNITSAEIPSWIFEKMNKPKETLESKVTGTIWDAKFVYTCNTEGPDQNQHETTTLYEQIDSSLSEFRPIHWIWPLEQILNANFQVFNMHTGDVVSDASVRILNGEKEVVGYVTPDFEGKFTVENLTCGLTYYAQVSHPTLRNMEYDFFVPNRTRFVQESEHPYVDIIPGDGTHKIALAVEPRNFVGKSEGLDINNPALTIDRVLEGQIGFDGVNIDGKVPRDYVMGDKVQVYNPSEMQITSMDTFAKKVLGGTSINDYFTIVDTARIEPGNEYNYLTGDENAGINWIGEVGNTTNSWVKNMFNNYGDMYGDICMGGDTESTNPTSSVHELFWYLYNECVYSEESPINPTAGNIGINDPLSVQYRMDVNKAKYKNGFYTGEGSDLRIPVEEFKSDYQNPYNILKLK